MRVRLRANWFVHKAGTEIDIGSGPGELLIQRGIAEKIGDAQVERKKAASPKSPERVRSR